MKVIKKKLGDSNRQPQPSRGNLECYPQTNPSRERAAGVVERCTRQRTFCYAGECVREVEYVCLLILRILRYRAVKIPLITVMNGFPPLEICYKYKYENGAE